MATHRAAHAATPLGTSQECRPQGAGDRRGPTASQQTMHPVQTWVHMHINTCIDMCTTCAGKCVERNVDTCIDMGKTGASAYVDVLYMYIC